MNDVCSLLLILLTVSLKIEYTKANTVVAVTVGQQYSFNCNSNGASYQWNKQLSDGNGYYELKSHQRYNGINSFYLTITNIQSTDAGTYQCTVTFDSGSTWRNSAVTLAINGNWGAWTSWSGCSETCGGGSQTRNRLCNNPPPSIGGSECSGSGTESQNCNTNSCTFYYTIGQTIILKCKDTTGLSFKWQRNSYFMNDDDSRIYGSETSELKITNSTLYDSNNYQCVVDSSTGMKHELKINVIVLDQVNGNWGNWSEWTACTKTCGGSGSRVRERSCDNPPPSNSIQYCEGDTHKNNYQSENDTTCANGITCPVNGGWAAYSSWSSCSETCGGGSQTRNRQCNNPPPSNGGSDCSGSGSESQSCNTADCPIHGNWNMWSKWSICTKTCGGGNWTRERNCSAPAPAHGGNNCSGSMSDVESCSTHRCPEGLSSDNNSLGAALGGSVGAVIVVLIIVVLLVVLTKRRKQSKKHTKSKRHQRLVPDGTNVIFKPEPERQDNLYLNIGGRTSSTDTDDGIVQNGKGAAEAEIDPNSVYCNVVLSEPPISTNIKVEELGEYIKKRQLKDGLQEEYNTLPYDAQYPTTIAKAKDNMPKNRFKFIFPYDHTRVVLHDGPDYINANFIDGFEKERRYIASQGPKKDTLVDHWRMIWQLNVTRIVMLTNLVECGKKKCEQYWPANDATISLGNLVLSLCSVKERATYVTRQISVEDKTTKERRTVVQYHFTSWPDHGTPDPLYLVLFYRHVLSEDSSSDTGPLLVHCSAGIGRTGTYIGLDALYEQGNTTGYIDAPAFVKKMRYCRMNMVQTEEQYVCLHQALQEAFTMTDRKIEKNEFGMVWRKILSDKRPINHQILREEYKMLEEKKADHAAREHTLAHSPENKDKHRSMLVLPADKDRVYLSTFESGRTDYINAVMAPSYTKLIGYITTQLPLPDTKVDFWTMIRDHESSIIVLFVKDQSEADFVYSSSNATGALGQNTLKILTNTDEDGIKVVSVTLSSSKKDVKHRDVVIYQVVCDGLPEAEVLCKLFNLMSTRITMAEGPVTVVSSDGAKICGLFCAFTNAVSSMLIDENADIFQLVRLLQVRRPEFFKDFEEYRKVYEAVNFYLESTNVYANF